jgi:hypothetical protein
VRHPGQRKERRHGSGLNPGNLSGEIFDHVLRAGTTAGQRWNWAGRRDGELEHVDSANVATGMQVLNAVPGVCAA